MFLRCLALTLLLPSVALAQNDTFGISVGSIGDLDGDGVAEFAVGSPGWFVDGRIIVFSGATGAKLLDFPAPEPSETEPGDTEPHPDSFGAAAIRDAGDLNGDGVPDFFVGDPNGGRLNGTSTYRAREGRAFAFDGSNGDLIYRFEQPSGVALRYRSFGLAIEHIGDIDGDDVSDLVISARDSPASSSESPGQVLVHSGSTGAWLRTDREAASENGSFGWPLVVLGDVDDDGVSDYYTNRFGFNHFVISGRTGEVLVDRDDFLLPITQYRYHGSIAVPDQDGDGIPDLATLDRDRPFLYIHSSATIELIRVIQIPDTDANTQVYSSFAADGDRAAALVKYYQGGPQVISIFSLATGEALLSVPPPLDIAGYEFGRDFAFLPDTNGDGVRDLLVGAIIFGAGPPPGSRGLAFVFSGADGSELRRVDEDGVVTVADEEPAVAEPLSVRVGLNPVRGRTAVTLTLPQAAVARVSVFDVLGRRVSVLADGALRAGETTLDLDASGWAPGVYLVRLATVDGVRTTRLTVAR